MRDRAAVALLLITENSAKTQKIWCDVHKTYTSDDWKYVIWLDESRPGCVWGLPIDACNSECLVP